MAAQRIGVLGTGPVGQALSGRLIELGHDVLVGSRTASSDLVRTFAEAAAHGDVVVNATGGIVSIEALTAAGADNLDGKPLVDISNALDHSAGFPPKVLATDSESLGERIQAAFPEALVVKTLNTMTNAVMVRPRSLPGPHTNFLAGNDDGAKAVVRGLLLEFGWTDEELVDLGDLSGSRGMELYLPLWLRTYGAVGHGMFNVHVVRAAHA
jgi:predicted dinucleotide-binding enzyme